MDNPIQPSNVDVVHRVFDDVLQDLRMLGVGEDVIDAAARPMMEEFLEVAIEVGFADASYFTKVFRKLTGMTPSAYRARSG